MAAIIELENGTGAIYSDGKWWCADPKAVPMLEYFTEQVLDEISVPSLPNVCAGVAKRVAAKIVGAKLVRYDEVDYDADAVY